ncbi:MAG: hypothetical protein R8M45_04890 [Ghiorsea sp.]
MAYNKSPSSTVDFTFDWTSWLAGDTLLSVTTTCTTGITINSTSNDTSIVTVWVSGGTQGTAEELCCEITTNAGRVEKKAMIISVTAS